MAVGWRPAQVWYRLREGRSALRSRDAEAALRWVTPVLSLAPENGEAHFWLARAYRRQGDMPAVRDHLHRARALGFPADQVTREEWLAMAQSGQMRDAAPHLSRLLIDPGEDGQDICEAYVNGFFLTCRFPEGLELLDVWQAEFPDDAQPYLFRGRYFSSVGNTQGAIAAYRAGLARDPDRLDLQLPLATLLVELRDFDSASQLLQSILSAAPDNIEALDRWSACLLEQGRAEDANVVLSRLLQRDTRHVRARLTRARAQSIPGRADNAVALAQAVVDERPYDLEAHYVLGRALQAAGRADEAAPHFEFVQTGRSQLQAARRLIETVVLREPDNVAARYEVGHTLLQYDAPEDGAGWLQSALDLDPRHQPSHAALAEYYTRCGNLSLAERHRRQLSSSPHDAPGADPG
jgi:tetratricopeptide (TPR) repeat protein